MPGLFQEADIAAQALRRQPGFTKADLEIAFRKIQQTRHPEFSGESFRYAFEIWRDQHRVQR